MQAHFSRKGLGHGSGDLTGDLREVVTTASRLLPAMVDVITTSGWLHPALAAMELSQMTVQGMWDRDSPLLQLPHVDREVAKACREAGVVTVFDLLGESSSNPNHNPHSLTHTL